MKKWASLVWLFFLGSPGLFADTSSLAGDSALASRVVIVANRASPESLELATHYASRRGIPFRNIVALPLPLEETISWAQFVDTLWTPLFAALRKDGWLDALPVDSVDVAGRRKFVGNGHRVSYLVLCRGVPLRIAENPGFQEKAPAALPMADARLQTNQACVDSELAVMPMGVCPLLSYVPNPLLGRLSPTALEREQLFQVSRLDGPDLASALALVDQAIEAEKTGWIGRSYLDYGGPYPEGDKWFMAAERHLEALGFDGDVDRGPRALAEGARFDAPALYLGWYLGDLAGPMAADTFRFPPGAIAYHLHSSSAPTLRGTQRGWVAPLIARRVTACFGNVYEPYLLLCQRPDLLAQALALGMNLGDAATFSLPGLSWQNLTIGDPLFQPASRNLEAQWENRRYLSARQASYVLLRKMRLMERANLGEAALELGLSELADRPDIVGALRVAKILIEKDRKKEAVQLLVPFLGAPPRVAADEVFLPEAAALLQQAEAADKALVLIEELLSRANLGRAVRNSTAFCYGDASYCGIEIAD